MIGTVDRYGSGVFLFSFGGNGELLLEGCISQSS